MYKIIGADGKEYGPVTLEQLQQWFAEGRINTETRVRSAEAADWKRLGDLPEFAGPADATSGTAPPPITATINPEPLATAILARDYSIQIGHCIGRGWTLVKANFWLLVGATFVGILIACGAGIPCIGPVIGLIVGGPMMGGLLALFLKRLRGQPASFGDAFIGFSTLFVPLMLANIVSSLLTGLGFLLLIIPGIYLAVAWSFTIALVIDKRLDFWPAMDLSRQVVSKHWWLIFGLLFVNGLVGLLGILCCGVGVFVAMPVAIASMMYAYEDIFGLHPTAAP